MKTVTFSGRNVDLYAQLNPASSGSSNSLDNSGNSSSSSSSSSSSHLSAISPNSTTYENGIGRPLLKIIEEPTSRVRFRYIVEQKKIYGAIKGKNSTESKKTFPTVKMEAKAKQDSQDMDMNKVCLSFEALKEDPATGELSRICEPVYSQPIMNSRDPATSVLKICDISKQEGSCNGGERVFMFVEKVCKGKIKVRFFELNEDGNEEWFDYATEQYVHRQYAIAFRTPPYKDKNIDKEVTVYIQLERPLDSCVSKTWDFTYKPQYQRTIAVKRKAKGEKHISLPPPQPFPQSDDTDITLEDIPILDPSQDLGMSESAFEDLRHSVLSDLQASVECSPFRTRGQQTDPTSDENFMKFLKKLGPDGWETYKTLLEGEPESEQPVFSNAGRSIHSTIVKQSVNTDNWKRTDLSIPWAGNNSASIFGDFTEWFFHILIRLVLFILNSLQGCVMYATSRIVGAAATNTEENPSVNKVAKKMSIDDKSATHLYFVPTKENLPQKVTGTVKKVSVENQMTKKVRLDQLKALLQHHIDGNNILHVAIMNSKETELEKLLDICQTNNMLHYVDSRNKEQKTPLHITAKLKLEKSVALLLSYEADPSIQDVLGNTPLHYATIVESINIVKKLVYAMKLADIEARNEAGQTVLHIAVGCKLYEIVETLLEAGADVNWYNDCTGDTPLHIAIKNCDLQMLHILLKADGIDVNAENFEQHTPLTCLLDSDSMEAANEICNALLEFKIKHST